MGINLIPADIAPQGSAAKLSNLLRTLSAIGLTIFILIVFGLTSFYLVSYFQLRASLSRQDNLKTVISSLQNTEASLILLKDRLSKVREVYAQDSADENIDAVSSVFTQVPSGVSISDFETAAIKIEISVLAQNSLSLSQFMATLVSSNLFETINLKSFSFSPTTGYSVTFELFRK